MARSTRKPTPPPAKPKGPPRCTTCGAVTALFVESGGVYFGLHGVDPWDAVRDARLYAGLDPVVAHPPCQLWVNLAAVNWKRYQRERPAWYEGGSDGGCFSSALASVRAFGGVLEHPAGSHAWRVFGLQKPGYGWVRACDRPNEWTCEVWQSAYGHRARKRTWLLYVGRLPPPDLIWRREPGTHQVGWFDREKPTLSKKEASRTPLAFRDELLSLARWARACGSVEDGSADTVAIGRSGNDINQYCVGCGNVWTL